MNVIWGEFGSVFECTGWYFLLNEGAGFAFDGVAFLYGRCVWHTYFKHIFHIKINATQSDAKPPPSLKTVYHHVHSKTLAKPTSSSRQSHVHLHYVDAKRTWILTANSHLKGHSDLTDLALSAIKPRSPRYTRNLNVFMPLRGINTLKFRTQTTFWNTETENKYRSSLNKQIIIMLVMLNLQSNLRCISM